MSKKNNPKADDFKLETTSFEIDDEKVENFDIVDNFDFSEYEKPKDKKIGATKKVAAKKKSGKMGYGWIIFISAITIVVAAGIFFFIQPDGIKKSVNKMSYPDDKEEVVDELVTDEDYEDFDESTENFDNQTEPVVDKKDLKENVTENKDEVVEEAILEEDKTENIKPEENQPVPSKQKKNWGLSLPCYIISHSAFSNESIAKAEKKKLTSLGFKSDYYWIPDITPGGKELYKVYVGPYKNQKDADKVISSVKKIKPTAYVQQIDN
jgi:cell division septation protein DedD